MEIRNPRSLLVVPPPVRLSHAGPRGFAAALTISCLFLTQPVEGQNVGVGTNIPAMTRGPGITRTAPTAARPAAEDPRLASALARLNAEARTKGDKPATWEAIAAESRSSTQTLRRQHAATRLTHGELIVANSLASKSGNSFEKIVTMRVTAGSWSQLARELRVDPLWIAARVTSADASLKKTKSGKS